MPERILLLEAFVSKCLMQTIHFKWRPNLRDEGDNHLMELAIAANAPNIVTSNIRDFQRHDLKFPGISAETPEDFVIRLMG